ncbi:MAG: hypothetical protein K6U04_08090 [Armatimonadetes bacterium]|nr:hypothetical protein [Armatimonadota bacterium]
MSKFAELTHQEMEQFLRVFTRSGTLRYGKNKWVGVSLTGKTFTVHRKHGETRKYPPSLVEAVAKKIGVSREEFWEWYKRK